MDGPSAAQRALFWLLIASMALVAFVLRPLAVALFLALVLATALWPLHARLTRLLRGKPKVSAGLFVLFVISVILGPLLGFSAFIVKEAAEATRFVSDTIRSEGVEGLLTRLPPPLESAARSGLERIPLADGQGLDGTVQQTVSASGGQAAAAVGAAVAATGSLLFQAVMMLIALFFFLTQKEAVLHWVDRASPLRPGQTRELLQEFRNVSGAVIRSSILTAAVQAAAALVGYFIARVPHPLFFASVTFFVALIPAVGAAVVCVAAALLLFVTGHTVAAIFLAIWGVAVVGLADNVVKPLLIRGGVQMHGAVVFFSLLGGLTAFGTIGLLVGPLAVAFFIALLRIYRRDYGGRGPGGEHKTPRPPDGGKRVPELGQPHPAGA